MGNSASSIQKNTSPSMEQQSGGSPTKEDPKLHHCHCDSPPPSAESDKSAVPSTTTNVNLPAMEKHESPPMLAKSEKSAVVSNPSATHPSTGEQASGSPTKEEQKKQHNPPILPAESGTCLVPSSPSAAVVHGEGKFSETQIEQMKVLLGAMISPIVDRLDSLDTRMCCVENGLDALGKRMCRVEKRTGILVEEKARKMATRQFGEDFSQSFIMKSIHDLVKILANADTKALQKRDYEARNKAVGELENILKTVITSFCKAAVKAVEKASEHELFQDPLFNTTNAQSAKKLFQDVVIKPIDEGKPSSELDWNKMIGVTLKLVKEFSKSDDESSDDNAKARAEMMNGRFKRKLERLKLAVEKNDLASCNSAGIMLLSALASGGKAVWKDAGIEDRLQWIEENCDVFDFKQEVECDLMPSVSAVGNHATIMVGEIKSSIDEYGEAQDKMLYTLRLLELGLFFVLGKSTNFNSVVKKGHLYVLGAKKEDDQHLADKFDSDTGMSIFVHKFGL